MVQKHVFLCGEKMDVFEDLVIFAQKRGRFLAGIKPIYSQNSAIERQREKMVGRQNIESGHKHVDKSLSRNQAEMQGQTENKNTNPNQNQNTNINTNKNTNKNRINIKMDNPATFTPSNVSQNGATTANMNIAVNQAILPAQTMNTGNSGAEIATITTIATEINRNTETGQFVHFFVLFSTFSETFTTKMCA